MAYEWHRFVYWLSLGQNAIAVQALAAALASAATIVLVGITGWYVYITQGLLVASQKQLIVALQPDLHLDIVGTLGRNSSPITIRVKIENNGGFPVRLEKGCAELGGKTFELGRISDRVVSPGRFFLLNWHPTTFSNPPDADPKMHVPNLGLRIVCMDLCGLSQHEFTYSQEHGQGYKRL